jgi:aconitase A
VLDIEETPDHSNILTEQLSSSVNDEEGENEEENEEGETENKIGDTIYVQPRRIVQQGCTQQQNTRSLMPADGLTKILVRQNHAEFIQQLGLQDVKACVTTPKGPESPDPASLSQGY